MARSRQEAAQRAEEAAAAELVPGTTILARVRGFPPWPAVVVDESDVPGDVQTAKPVKKVVVPVLFYNDNNFLWLSPSETESLDSQGALKASKSKIKKQLKEAYAIAADPPPYKELLVNLKRSKEPDMEVEEMEEIQEVEPAPRNRRARSAADRAAGANGLRVPRAAPGTGRKRTKDESTSKRPKLVNSEDDSEYVDTGETDELSTTESEVGGGSLTSSQAARFALCVQVRRALQNLLHDAYTAQETEEAVDAMAQFKDAPEIEISVLRRSKLPRVVGAVLTLSSIKSDLRTDLEAAEKLWDTSAEPVIRGIPEHLAPKEETEELEDYGSKMTTREPTEEPMDFREKIEETTELVKVEESTHPVEETVAVEVPEVTIVSEMSLR